MTFMDDVREMFGDIDIYLFDQIQKGRFTLGMRILDAGCGGGRNLIYFLKSGFDVSAVDQNPDAVSHVKSMAVELAPGIDPANFRVAAVEKMPFADNSFDWVISNAVLHFARDGHQFDQMLREMWRVLKPNGVLFARLASSIGIEEFIVPAAHGRYDLPDGSERFLVDQEMLLGKTERLGGHLIEPIKTTNVQNLRAMTTWVLSKTI
jgi:SAM-dependent methyltransferase